MTFASLNEVWGSPASQQSPQPQQQQSQHPPSLEILQPPPQQRPQSTQAPQRHSFTDEGLLQQVDTLSAELKKAWSHIHNLKQTAEHSSTCPLCHRGDSGASGFVQKHKAQITIVLTIVAVYLASKLLVKYGESKATTGRSTTLV